MANPPHALRDYRTAKKETLKSMGRRVGVTEATISRIETRKQVPSLLLAGRLSRVTGIPIEEFLPVIAAPSNNNTSDALKLNT